MFVKPDLSWTRKWYFTDSARPALRDATRTNHKRRTERASALAQQMHAHASLSGRFRRIKGDAVIANLNADALGIISHADLNPGAVPVFGSIDRQFLDDAESLRRRLRIQRRRCVCAGEMTANIKSALNESAEIIQCVRQFRCTEGYGSQPAGKTTRYL